MSTKWPDRCSKLIGVIMVKNEAQRIVQTTLNSIRDYCSELVIFDTGSTDDTIEVIQKFCTDNDMKLNLKQGNFVNFCVSRNVMLDFCDEIYPTNDTYLLLLDAHDELQEGKKLVEFINDFKGSQSGIYLTQRWWSGNNLDSYYNVRMVRAHKQWRYHHVVHEYLMTPLLSVEKRPENEIIFRLEGVYLYQDRTLDDDKSFKRFKRDKEMLYNEHVKDPKESRTLFYLAQTCSCLGLNEEAYKYYILRSKEAGFGEEVFHAYYRLGDAAQALGHDWEESLMWYLRAFQHSQRAEPLLKIAEHYIDFNLQGEKHPEWHTCFMYANMASNLIYPVNQILFVDKEAYTYKRHHILGRCAYYVGRFREGKESCLRAIEAKNQAIDKSNLRFYLLKDLELINGRGLNCPALLAVTFGDKEVRAKDELDVKHDRNKVINEVIDNIVDEHRKSSQPLSSDLVDRVRLINKTNVQVETIASSAAATTANDSHNHPKKDKRAQLRMLLQQKKEGRKGKKA